MSTKGCRTLCSGNTIKTSFCPALGCSRSWTGNSRTINQSKTTHIKVCPFIVDDTERKAYLKNKCLRQNSSGIGRAEYVKPSEKTLCLDPKESVRKEIMDAYAFLRILEKDEIKQKRSENK
jgi:hypothetical protein